MAEKSFGTLWRTVPGLPWVLGLALFTIVGAHLMAWVNTFSLAASIRTQQELFVGLTEYQGLLSDLDESTRAIMLAPDRPELRRKKSEAVEALQHQLGVLAEQAPIQGPVRKELIGLATHFRKKLIPQADQVQKHAAAPGPFAMERFRTEYAEARLQHAEKVAELLEETRQMAGESIASGQHRLLMSAGFLLLLWSGAMAWLVAQVRLHPQAPAAGAHAVLASADAAHVPEHAPASSTPPHDAHELHSESAEPSSPGLVAAPEPPMTPTPGLEPLAVVDPTAPPPREPELRAEEIAAAPAMPAGAASAHETVPLVAAAPTESAPMGSAAASGGEMSPSQIADLLRQPEAPATAGVPSAPASGATPSPAANAASLTTPPVAPAPSASTPTVLPPGPVDLASLMGGADESSAPSAVVSAESAAPADQPAPPSPVPVPSVAPPVPAVVEAERTSVTPAPVAATPAAVPVPVAPASEPAAVVAASPAPLPDVQTLMKGASAMTTEQLTAMLFGVGPAASPATSPSNSAPPTSQPVAPAAVAPAAPAVPAAPPRTITGAEMATLKPGEDTPGVVDLSF